MSRWPDWLLPVSILVGAALLIIGVIYVLTGPTWPARINQPNVYPVAPTGSNVTTPAESPTFDGLLAYRHVLAQAKIGPRPTGSETGWATGDYIITELNKAGWSAESQTFIFKGVNGRNIIGRPPSRPDVPSPSGLVMLGAHYDTRPAADHNPDQARRNDWIQGANDGASGVAILLELARVLASDELDHQVWLVFFDAEDRGQLEGWSFSVGARFVAERLRANPQSVIIVDMVGDADQNIYFERNSTARLSQEIWNVAAGLGYEPFFIPEVRHFVIDDHIPFLERDIPAVDIIDFDYPYWHTVEDTVDKIAPESLERVGRTLEEWLEKSL